MVVKSHPVTKNISFIKTCSCRPTTTALFKGIPVVDLLDRDAKSSIVKACQDFGFFKVVNHGVPLELVTRLEAEAVNFFNLPQSEKDKVGLPKPLGYGNKNIGLNGDVGWVEYLLFSTSPEVLTCQKSFSSFPGNSNLFCSLLRDYVSAVRNMVCELLEMMADGLRIEARDVFSRMLRDESSDSLIRLNHYPPCPELQALSGRSLLGFGEHTDPQIISVLRDNSTTGLQVSMRDGTWVSVPSDRDNSFCINVGDSLQVMTNGRFKSVKHRVVVESLHPRLSMIYFGGPPLSEKIAPLSSLMIEEGEVSLYREFTWSEYKQSAYKTRLSDNRLTKFQNSSAQY